MTVRTMGLMLPMILLACTEQSSSTGDTAVSVDSAAAGSPSSPSGGTPAVQASDAGAMLALDGEGLRVILLPSGSTRLIAFGETRSVVVETVSRLRSGTLPEVAENVDCGATVATWPVSGLQLWFTSDPAARFIGWSLGGRAPANRTLPEVTTMSGIGLGSTRAALESVYDAKIAKSLLGVEFSAGGLAGLLASAQADAPIQNLWAGQVCLAR